MPSPGQRQFTELLDWLRSRKPKSESLRAFGRRTKIDKSVLWKLVNGKLKRCNPIVLRKIELATGGAVGLAEYMAFCERLQPRPKRRAA